MTTIAEIKNHKANGPWRGLEKLADEMERGSNSFHPKINWICCLRLYGYKSPARKPTWIPERSLRF